MFPPVRLGRTMTIIPFLEDKAFEPEDGHDISPVISVTLAKLGLDTYGSKPPLKPFFLS